jgi:hypothetical protein
MSRPRVFVPHRECTLGDGDCFRAGRCVNECRPRRTKALAPPDYARHAFREGMRIGRSSREAFRTMPSELADAVRVLRSWTPVTASPTSVGRMELANALRVVLGELERRVTDGEQ